LPRERSWPGLRELSRPAASPGARRFVSATSST
jgi:hypothetical protein